jgi:2-polyprenyl-3-methyl-5-hydroxy-6-metoxy-1,4-benzoquinol methylase
MTFYEELSRYYDEIFPADAAGLAFLNQALAGKTRLLDLGCGTGNKTKWLAAPGREVLGLDLAENMIARARLDNAGPGLNYQAGDLTAFGRELENFDGLVCLGNTLVHLTEPGDLEQFARDASKVLIPGGLLIIQILNYDHILDSGLTELPLIDTGRVIFRRRYQPSGPVLRFQTRLEIKGGPAFDNDIPLKPIRRAFLTTLLANAFEDISLYGGYDGRPLAATDLVLLALARRKAVGPL